MRKIAIITGLLCLFLGVFDVPNFARIKQTGFGDIDVSIQTDKQKIKENLNNIKNIGFNSKIAGGRTLDSLSDLASSVRENKADLIGTIDDYQDATARREAFSQLTVEELDLIQNPEKYDIESQKYVADKFNHIYSEMRGLEQADAQFFDDEKLENEQGKGTKASETTAFYDPDKNDIYFEADKIQDDNNMAHALGHESKRQDLNQKNSQESEQTTIAFDAGKHSKQAFERELKYKDVQIELKQNYVRSSEDNNAIQKGSNNASKVENVEPYIGKKLRQLWVQDYQKQPEESIQDGIDYSAKVGKVALVELPFSPISPGDISRIVLGKNPYNGNELSDTERLNAAASTITYVFGTKILKYTPSSLSVEPYIQKAIKKFPKLIHEYNNMDKGINDLNEKEI